MVIRLPRPEDFTDDERMRMLCNPWYCTDISSALTRRNVAPPAAVEDWINANATLIEKIGAAKWLELLLREMSEPHVPHVPYRRPR